jgi:hypothetical protein
MRFFLTLFLFMLLCGVPGAHAGPCLKADCSQDPQAWADMLGHTPAERAEQKVAREAAEHEVDREHARDLAAIPVWKKEQMVFEMESSLSRLSGQRYQIMTVKVLPRGSEYVYCGVAETVGLPFLHGVFVFDTRPSGIKTMRATYAQFQAAGCTDKTAVGLR